MAEKPVNAEKAEKQTLCERCGEPCGNAKRCHTCEQAGT
jgi:hypothetical protein